MNIRIYIPLKEIINFIIITFCLAHKKESCHNVGNLTVMSIVTLTCYNRRG